MTEIKTQSPRSFKSPPGTRTCLATLAVNLALSALKLVVGFIAASPAVIADGFHSLSDAGSDILVLFAFVWSRKPRDTSHPYGHGKIETFFASILGTILVILGYQIARSGVSSLSAHTLHSFGYLTIPVTVASIAVKELLYHYNMHMSRKLRSPSLHANAWHHRSDALSSIIVLIGIVSANYGLSSWDPFAAIIVAGIIAATGIMILIKTGKELVETSVDKETLCALKTLAESHTLVKSSHLIFARNVGANMVIDLHIVVSPTLSVREAHVVTKEVEKNIRSVFPQAHSILIHVDPYDDEFEELAQKK